MRTAGTNVLELTKDKFVFERVNTNKKKDLENYNKIIVVVNNGYADLPLEYEKRKAE